MEMQRLRKKMVREKEAGRTKPSKMTREEILALFPNASHDTIARNLENSPARIPTDHPKPDQGGALERSEPGEATCWYGPARRFEIRFIVYSCRPCDWDGYDIKALQDIFVRAQIIPSDGWRVLAGRVEARKVHTEAEERTEVEIRVVE